MHLVSIQGCVSPVLALSAMFEADRQMCMKYVGAAGGGEAAALSLYPFTSEILTNMRVTKKYIYIYLRIVRCCCYTTTGSHSK